MPHNLESIQITALLSGVRRGDEPHGGPPAGELDARGDSVTIRALLPELAGERRAAAEAALGELVQAG